MIYFLVIKRTHFSFKIYRNRLDIDLYDRRSVLVISYDDHMMSSKQSRIEHFSSTTLLSFSYIF